MGAVLLPIKDGEQTPSFALMCEQIAPPKFSASKTGGLDNENVSQIHYEIERVIFKTECSLLPGSDSNMYPLCYSTLF